MNINWIQSLTACVRTNQSHLLYYLLSMTSTGLISWRKNRGFCDVSPYFCIFSILKVIEVFQLPPKGPQLNFFMQKTRAAAFFSVIYHWQTDMHHSEIQTSIDLPTRLSITAGSVRNHPKWKLYSLVHALCLPFVALIIHSMYKSPENM